MSGLTASSISSDPLVRSLSFYCGEEDGKKLQFQILTKERRQHSSFRLIPCFLLKFSMWTEDEMYLGARCASTC